MTDSLEQLVKDFFRIVDAVEESDEGRLFFPTQFQISSCRSMSVKRLSEILRDMRTIVGARDRMTDKEMYVYNNPHGCGNCLGQGQVNNKLCPHCQGSGSSDRTICKVCKGTGQCETDECHHCNSTGINPDYVCPDCKGNDYKCKTCNGEGVIKSF